MELEGEPWKADDDREGGLVEPHIVEFYLKKMLADEQGTMVDICGLIPEPERKPKTVRLWDKGKYLLTLLGWFKKHQINLMTVYSQGHPEGIHMDPEVVRELNKQGKDVYLGENIGEYLNSWSGRPDGVPFKNLQEAKDFFINDYLGARVTKLKKMGYPRIFTTGSHSFSNYELEAGVDIPMFESLIAHVGGVAYSMSEMRGACRKWSKPFWGSYFAHDWYTRHIPYHAQQKFDLIRVAMYLSWMNGAFGVVLESGNFQIQAGKWTKDSNRNYGYSHKICGSYRKEMRDFYRFTKQNKRDSVGPIVRYCFALGNLDGFQGRRSLLGQHDEYHRDRSPVWGLAANAKENGNYLYGEPEQGWDIMFKVVYPMSKTALAPYYNHYLSGSPFGVCDVVGIDRNVSEKLLSSYNLLVYTGWNTMEPEIYQKLIRYIKAGGNLLMAVPHLSTRDDREYWSYSASDLINKGDLSELFDLKVKGKGQFIYNGEDLNRWENKAYSFFDFDVENESGFARQTIADIRAEVLTADVNLGPEAEVLFRAETRGEFLSGKSTDGRPLFIRRKLGRGYAYLVTAWNYPGAIGMRRLYTHILKNLLFNHRDPAVYINDISLGRPDKECVNIFYTVYDNTVYLLNTDCIKKHQIELCVDGQLKRIELDPGEFRIISPLNNQKAESVDYC